MDRLLRDRVTSFLLLVAASAILPFAILHFFGGNEVQIEGWVHFWVLAAASLIAAAASITLTAVGARRADGRAVLLGTAFSTMTGLLAVHGLATYDFLVGENGVGAFSGAAVLPIGGFVLALSALPQLRRPQMIRPLVAFQIFVLLAVLGLGTIGLLFPDSVPPVPETDSAPALIVLALGLAFFFVITVRAIRTFTLTRRRADFVVVLGLVWLAVALQSQLLLSWSELGWWIGHALELIGVTMVGIPVALDLHRGAQSRPLSGDLLGAELVAQEEAFLGPRVRAMMVRLADKDAYTELHTRGVALRSVQVGERLGLSPGRLRELAIGGLLHDVGKLSVPDEILQKPGPLSDDEFEVIKRHPEWGAELIDELGGFTPAVRKLVLGHHERLDGSGYPRGLRDDEIDLETRILAVCDVYDALVSKRVYRDAWSSSQALALLETEADHEFDRRCVDALARVLEAETRAPQLATHGGRSRARYRRAPATV
jgi:HD-GYP domain-containing protein (c-di-GMP phosphodiesterase class II)